MNSLVSYDEFTASQALRGLELERERLRKKLCMVSRMLAATRSTFAEVLEILASRRAPMEYEIATRQAKIVSLGGQWKNLDSRWNTDENIPVEEVRVYRNLYRKIADLLHYKGDFQSPEVLQKAKEAIKDHDFLTLYHVYRTVLREARKNELPEEVEMPGSGCAEEKRRTLAHELRLLRMSIQSAQEQLDGIETHPLYLAWLAGTHERFIEAICDELRRTVVQLDWELTELQSSNKNRGGLCIVR